MRAIVLEAARHELRVMAHAHGTAGIIAAAQAGVASIEHASILNEEAIQALVDNDTRHPLVLAHLDPEICGVAVGTDTHGVWADQAPEEDLQRR